MARMVDTRTGKEFTARLSGPPAFKSDGSPAPVYPGRHRPGSPEYERARRNAAAQRVVARLNGRLP